MIRWFDHREIGRMIKDKPVWLVMLAGIGLMVVVGGLIPTVIRLLPEQFHFWADFLTTVAILIGLFGAVWVWQRQSHWRDISTSDESVYERLRRGKLGDWMFEDLVGQGLTVDAALAKMQTAATRIKQETGKQPSMPTAKKIQRLRRAEQRRNG